MKTCPKCGYHNQSDALFCNKCGERLNGKEQYKDFTCEKCGAPLTADAYCKLIDCEFCGTINHNPFYEEPEESWQEDAFRTARETMEDITNDVHQSYRRNKKFVTIFPIIVFIMILLINIFIFTRFRFLR